MADDEISIRGEFENNISRPAEAAARSVDELGDEARETAAELAMLEAAEAGAAAEADNLGDSVDRTTRRVRRNTKIVDDNRRSHRSLANQYAKSNRLVRATAASSMLLGRGLVMISNFAVSVRRGLVMAFGPLAMVARIGAMIELVGLLAVGLKAVGAAGIVAANGLGPLIGMLAVIPAGIGSMMQGMGTVKMGTAGLGNAWQTMNNKDATQEQKTDAFKNVHPNALKFLRTLKQISPEFLKVRKSIQGRLFAGLAKDMKPLAERYLPMIKEHFGDTAENLNDVVRTQLRWLQGKNGVKQMNRFMSQNSKIVKLGALALARFLRIMLRLSNAAGPMVMKMLRDVNGLLDDANRYLRDNSKAVENWLIGSYERLVGILRVVRDFAIGLFNIFRIATPWTEEMGKKIGDAAKNFREWTESVAGQKRIKKFFEEFMPVFYQVLGLVGDILKMFMRLGNSEEFKALVEKIRKDVLPALEELIESAEGKFIPALLEIFIALANLANSGFIDIFAGFLKQIAGYITQFADWFEGLSPQMKKWIVGFFAVFFLFGRLLAPLGKLFMGFGKLIIKLFGKGGAMAGMAGRFLGVAGAVLALAMAFWWLWQNSQGFRDAIIEIGQFLSDVFWTQIFPILWKFSQEVQLAWDQIAYALGYDGGIAGFMQMVADAWAIAWPIIQFIIMAMVNAFRLVMTVLMIIIGATSWLIQLMIGFWTWIWNIATAIWGMAQSIWGAMMFILPLWSMVGGTWISVVWGIVGSIVGAIAGMVGRVVGWISSMVGRIVGLIQQIPGAFSSMVGRAIGAVSPLIGALNGIAAAVRGIISSINGAISGVMGRVSAAKAAASSVNLFTGGMTTPGALTTVGELGPEIMISRSGQSKMVGLNGPELIRPGGRYAVVNASTTANPWSGDTDQSPSWAVNALRGAYGAGADIDAPTPAGKASEGPVAPVYDYTTKLTIENLQIRGDEDLDELEWKLTALLKKISVKKKRNGKKEF